MAIFKVKGPEIGCRCGEILFHVLKTFHVNKKAEGRLVTYNPRLPKIYRSPLLHLLNLVHTLSINKVQRQSRTHAPASQPVTRWTEAVSITSQNSKLLCSTIRRRVLQLAFSKQYKMSTPYLNMEPYNYGLFAGFNLEKERCLQNLAIALEYWLAGGRDDKSKEMEKLTQVQERTIGHLAQTMSQSPLLGELLTRLLQAFRSGRSNELVAAGKDLIDYAIPGIEQPGTSAYNDAVVAWQNRWPMPPRVNALRNYGAPMQKDAIKLVYGKRRREDTCEVDKSNVSGIDFFPLIASLANTRLKEFSTT